MHFTLGNLSSLPLNVTSLILHDDLLHLNIGIIRKENKEKTNKNYFMMLKCFFFNFKRFSRFLSTSEALISYTLFCQFNSH